MKRTSDSIRELRLKTVKTFGKQIVTATGCENLAAILVKNPKANISAQTLRRFFGLVRTASKPSQFTLDVLAKYCGFTDFPHFADANSHRELEQFFGADEKSGKDFWQKSEELCRQISDSAELLISTHQRMMPYPLARKYFMENHPMRDMLGTVYSQYFLCYLKFNTSNEAKIFAYGFLFKSAFLQGNEELMKVFYRQIAETELTPDVFVIPAGLKYGTMLLYADLVGDEALFAQAFTEMKEVRERYIPASSASVCSFEYTVLESLIFTDRKSEIQFLLENNTRQQLQQQKFIPADRKATHDEVWKILCAVGFHKVGDTARSQKYLEFINLENLGFGWRKYYSLIYYFFLAEISEARAQNKLCTKLRELVDETHFSFYEDRLAKIEAFTKARPVHIKKVSL